MAKLDWFILILVLVIAAAGGILYFWKDSPRVDTEMAPKTRALGMLPGDWAVTSLDGKELRMSDLRGKVVFINRWATWCGPCVMEMPSIQALHDSLKDANVAFVIVSDEEMPVVKEFVAKKGWSLPIYLASEGFPRHLQTDGIPATFIANSKGEIVFGEMGAKDWNTDEVRRKLKSIQ
jgi:thiol-disulfide isomerase/thioredoxin